MGRSTVHQSSALPATGSIGCTTLAATAHGASRDFVRLAARRRRSCPAWDGGSASSRGRWGRVRGPAPVERHRRRDSSATPPAASATAGPLILSAAAARRIDRPTSSASRPLPPRGRACRCPRRQPIASGIFTSATSDLATAAGHRGHAPARSPTSLACLLACLADHAPTLAAATANPHLSSTSQTRHDHRVVTRTGDPVCRGLTAPDRIGSLSTASSRKPSPRRDPPPSPPCSDRRPTPSSTDHRPPAPAYRPPNSTRPPLSANPGPILTHRP